jgi:hypothetical protein
MAGTAHDKKARRSREKRLRRGFGRLAALGAILAAGGLVGLVYTGLARPSRRCFCSAGCC